MGKKELMELYLNEIYPENKMESQDNKLSVEINKNKSDLYSGYKLYHSKHSLQRANQRGIDDEMIYYTIMYGDSTLKQGLSYHTMTSHGCNFIGSSSIADRVKNLTVVINPTNGVLITCYKNRNAYKNIKKKNKYLS